MGLQRLRKLALQSGTGSCRQMDRAVAAEDVAVMAQVPSCLTGTDFTAVDECRITVEEAFRIAVAAFIVVAFRSHQEDRFRNSAEVVG